MTHPDNSTQEHTPLHPATRIGHVHYTVANIERQIAFYRDVLGFQVHWQDGNQAGLGAGGADLLRFTENTDAQLYEGTTGLYHTAFLVPTRWELAQLLKRIAETRTPIQGTANHGTHLALYLPDAEGNGIELAWDFPEAQWPKTFDEMLRYNQGVSPQELFTALADNPTAWDGIDSATTVGHVHLHVSQLAPTMHFYRDILGFGLPLDLENAAPNRFTESAIFFAAGTYHHHIGTNVWQGVGAPPPPADATGLRHYAVVLPATTELENLVERVLAAGITADETADGWLIHDPAQNGILLTADA